MPTKNQNKEFSLRLLTETIEAHTTDEQLRVIKEIGLTIYETGLPLHDAALIARIEMGELDMWIKDCPAIKTYFDIRTLEYKRDLLKIVNEEAREKGDVKQAAWLLETHFATEYNPVIKKELEKIRQADQTDVLAIAIARIRQAPASAISATPTIQHPDSTTQRPELPAGTPSYTVSEVLK